VAITPAPNIPMYMQIVKSAEREKLKINSLPLLCIVHPATISRRISSSGFIGYQFLLGETYFNL
jgi:hypothetical protein